MLSGNSWRHFAGAAAQRHHRLLLPAGSWWRAVPFFYRP
jgi:hypothetical protein